MSAFSFFCFTPILSIGMFDRNLEKSYVKKNPEVYKPTQQNEMITPRTLFRWAVITLAHVLIYTMDNCINCREVAPIPPRLLA